MTTMTEMTTVERGSGTRLAERSAAFLEYLDRFVDTLEPVTLGGILDAAGGAGRVAVVAVDVVNGFCVSGPLASERVGAIVGPIRRLFEAAHREGIRAFAVLRDSHSPDAPEFGQFGQHCLAGTAESALVRDLADLPFAATFADVPKNATSAWVGTVRFREWAAEQEAAGVNTFVIAGDCTDLCVYQTAMPLKLRANAQDRQVTVIVPADCVDTYDLPVEVARGLGATPHDAGLLHAVFLYHMALNGVRVAREIRG
jgi:nicotinamidase-related amidase